MENDIQMKSDDTSSEFRDIFKERYHELNKRLLCVCGLEPSQPLKTRLFRTVGLLIASFIVMAGQVRAMVKAWGHFNLFIECFTPVETNIVGILKLITAMIQTREVRKRRIVLFNLDVNHRDLMLFLKTKAICDQMQKDWDDMRHTPQLHILKKYAEKGRKWTIFYITLIYGGLYLWIILAFSPKILDALAPLNHSRRRLDLFPTDFIVDQDEYFYEILIPIAVGVSYQFIVSVAIDTLYMVIAQHVCGMLEILRYNLHNVLKDNESSDLILNPGIHEDKHYQEIISCIKKHKVIVEYVKSIEAACGWRLLIIIGLSMVGLSGTGYLVVAGSEGSPVDLIRFGCFGIAQVFHMFCNTLPSHWIMESSSHIPTSAYSSKWYMMSLRSRKLILFLIRASIEPCKITAGKVYVVSMENFSGVLQTSMSYLAMLNSLQ